MLKQVVKEEEKQIEDDYKGSLLHAQHGGKDALDRLKQLRKERLEKKGTDPQPESDSDAPSESDSDSEEVPEDGDQFQKPVDRLKKLTKNQRN